jgi:hypothetical protein
MAEPNKDLILFKRGYYWQYALLIGALVYFVLDPMRLWWKFDAATVTVTSVRQLCAAFEKGKAMPLGVDECPLIEKQYAGKTDIEIKPRTFVSFDYTSPADGKPYSTSIVRDKDDQGNPLASGSRITVHLSTSDPLLVQPE